MRVLKNDEIQEVNGAILGAVLKAVVKAVKSKATKRAAAGVSIAADPSITPLDPGTIGTSNNF